MTLCCLVFCDALVTSGNKVCNLVPGEYSVLYSVLGVAGVLYVFRILRNTKALGVGLFVSFRTNKQRQSSVCGQLDSVRWVLWYGVGVGKEPYIRCSCTGIQVSECGCGSLVLATHRR